MHPFSLFSLPSLSFVPVLFCASFGESTSLLLFLFHSSFFFSNTFTFSRALVKFYLIGLFSYKPISFNVLCYFYFPPPRPFLFFYISYWYMKLVYFFVVPVSVLIRDFPPVFHPPPNVFAFTLFSFPLDPTAIPPLLCHIPPVPFAKTHTPPITNPPTICFPRAVSASPFVYLSFFVLTVFFPVFHFGEGKPPWFHLWLPWNYL